MSDGARLDERIAHLREHSAAEREHAQAASDQARDELEAERGPDEALPEESSEDEPAA